MNTTLITHGSVSGAESESVILVPFDENQGFASNVQTRVMVITMLWRAGRSDGLVVLVGCERNFAGSRDLERLGLAQSLTINMWLHWIYLNNPRNKMLWPLGAAAIPTMLLL